MTMGPAIDTIRKEGTGTDLSAQELQPALRLVAGLLSLEDSDLPTEPDLRTSVGALLAMAKVVASQVRATGHELPLAPHKWAHMLSEQENTLQEARREVAEEGIRLEGQSRLIEEMIRRQLEREQKLQQREETVGLRESEVTRLELALTERIKDLDQRESGAKERIREYTEALITELKEAQSVRMPGSGITVSTEPIEPETVKTRATELLLELTGQRTG